MTIINGTGGDDNLKGTKFDDYMYGGDGDDFLQGKAGNDYMEGNAGDDELHGDEGDDTLVGGQGDDIIDGGSGTDTAVYSGSVTEYSFSSNGENFYVSHTGGSHIDGNDRLHQVERLKFSDVVIDLGHNNAPLAVDDSVLTNEDVGTYSSGSAKVTDNDFDFEHDTLTVTPGTFNGTYGTFVLNANGTYTYTPFASTQGLDTGESVQDSFSYTVSDGSLSDTGTITFTITGNNDAPVANDDTASTTEDASVSGNVLANDTDVDGETLTVANPGTYVGAYGTLVLNANGSYTYTPNAAAQGLDTGETAQDIFSYTASDGTASDSATLTVTVTGANDAPVANDDTAATTEDASVSGNVLANDTDVDGEPLTVANPGTYTGSYGTLTLAANGSYTYTPNAAAQGLDTGETAQDVFTYTASDGTASDTATLTVTVNGANDAPVANDDTAATTEDASASGNVLANDTDVDGEPLTVANPGTYVGAYGTLTLAADGSYTYAPNAAAQGLDTGETAQDVFTYTASDGTASDTATLTVTVNGANDAPVANDDTASTSEDGSASGNVLANDTDVDGEALTVTNPGTYVGAYGTLTLAANGSYTYTPNAAAQGLDTGETAQDVFTYTASDGTASDTATLTVTVSGANDAPVANDDTVSTDEDTNVSGNVLTNDTDVDGEALAVTNPGTYVGTYGTLTLAADGSYTYVPNAAAQALNAGDTVDDVFAYTASDGTASDSATLTVTVTGADEGPQTDWYIDNSAVGSTNVGTQANPFTSIAAFNAAQGTVGGPQVGANVYLLAGLGTYTEADGINLLDDQVLTGVPSGAVRPTIVATAGDGINVAQGNDVAHIDVGNTSGAGIADSGGTVGTLTVSDVGKTGTGQIVDIDQGGTLNVTLNYTQSLGSSGGAVDLNGVGGTFTAQGWMDITGAQSGGGIDITNSSIVFTLAGGGAVFNTTSAGGVSFVGNTGSFNVTGGFFDVSTTSGTGLLVENGGTVAISGFSNNISSASGSAVIIRNASSAGVTLESVTSFSGSANAIILDNAGSGGFTITGLGGAAGSGGTITSKTGADGSTTNGTGIWIANTSNVSLAHMTISANANGGIVGTNVTNFTLTDSTLNFGNGSNVNEGGIVFNGLIGTASLLGNAIGGSSGDNVSISNSAGSLNLTIADSGSNQAIIGSTNNVTGDDGVSITTSGSASLTLLVNGVEFQGARGDLLQTSAFGNSSQNIVISNNNFINGQASSVGGGINLSGGGTGTNIAVDYRVEDNLFTGAKVSAISANYTQQAGIVRGYISGNTIGVDDGVATSQGSSGGLGIFAGLEKEDGAGDASYYLIIADNDIHDIAGFAGIGLHSNGGDATDTATVEAIIHDNVVDEMGSTAWAALYAMVGGTGVDFATFGLEIDDNVFDATGAQYNAVYLDQISFDAHYYFPGYAGSPDGEYMGGTASADLDTYLSARGNVMTNGVAPMYAGGEVDAQIIFGATGDMVAAPWYP